VVAGVLRRDLLPFFVGVMSTSMASSSIVAREQACGGGLLRSYAVDAVVATEGVGLGDGRHDEVRRFKKSKLLLLLAEPTNAGPGARYQPLNRTVPGQASQCVMYHFFFVLVVTDSLF
jgi:hypothetical protein